MFRKHTSGAVSKFCRMQGGAAFTETILVLVGLTVCAIVVTAIFLGGSVFSPAQTAPLKSGQALFSPSSGVFSPIDQMGSSQKNHDRMYSTVKGAITDFENSSTDTPSTNTPVKDSQ